MRKRNKAKKRPDKREIKELLKSCSDAIINSQAVLEVE